MGIRLSGLSSGFDTEKIIKELMAAKSLKKTKIEQKKTKLEWTQDKWKDLNSKLNALYNKQVFNMRLQSTYKTKEVASSDPTKATATAGPNASTGSHTLAVNQLASPQFLTSDKLSLADGSGAGVTGTTKLTDLGFSTSGTNSVINISGTKDVAYIVTADSTVNHLVAALQKAGLTASFDSNQQRFFISSANSGASNQFSVTTGTVSNAFVAIRDSLRNTVGYDDVKNVDKDKIDNAFKAFYYGGTGGSVSMDNLNEAQTDAHLLLIDYTTKAAKNQTITEANKAVRDAVISQEFGGKSQEEVIKEQLKKEITANNDTLLPDEVELLVNEKYNKWTEAERQAVYDKIIDNKVAEVKAQESYQKIYQDYIANNEENNINNRLIQLDTQLVDYAANSGETKYTSGATPLSFVGLAEISLAKDTNGISRVQISGADGTMITDETTNTLYYGGVSLVGAQDAIFVLDGARLTSENNSFTVNNLNLNLLGKTDSLVTISVTNDTKAIYDTIKGFITEYNNIIKEMNDLYYADSSRGYEPLTDDEKAAMTDDQIDQWETKIKDSILRRDTTLGSVLSVMKQAMQSSVEIEDKRYSLSSFGICTSFEYSEKGLYHIYGDTTDPTYANETDKLMKALSDDPTTTINAFIGIAENLSAAMQDKMKSTSLSSALTFYNDKLMKTQISEYKTQISDWEDRLTEMENRYYKQFTAMERAMSKLNSQSSNLSSLMG